MTLRLSSLLLAVAWLALPARAQQVAPDPSFDTSPISRIGLVALDAAVDLKDRPLQVAREGGPPSDRLSIVRLQPNGAPDPSFGDGEILFRIPDARLRIPEYGLVGRIDHDDLDRVVVVGSYETETVRSQPFLLRFNENGTPDTDVAPDGFTFVDVGFPAEVTGLAIHGRRVFVGLHEVPTGACYVAALTPDGRVDPTFGWDGLADLKTDGGCTSRDLIATGEGLFALAEVEGDAVDHTVVAGITFDGGGLPGFGSGGYLWFSGDGADLTPTTLRAWDGAVAVAGSTRGTDPSAPRGLFVARVLRDGTLDGTFADGAGLYLGQPTSSVNALRVGLALSQGALVVTTSARASREEHVLLATVFAPSGERVAQDGPGGFYQSVQTSDRSREYPYQSVGAGRDSRERVVVGGWRVLSGSGVNRSQVARLIVSPSASSPVDVIDGPDAARALAPRPNPSAGAAWVTLDRPALVTVHDVVGREVGRVEGVGRLALPVGGLAPGVYLVVAEGEGARRTARLTVVR